MITTMQRCIRELCLNYHDVCFIFLCTEVNFSTTAMIHSSLDACAMNIVIIITLNCNTNEAVNSC